MNNLRHISHEEWREMLKSFSFDSLMGFDPGNKMLKNILRDELESHNFKSKI